VQAITHFAVGASVSLLLIRGVDPTSPRSRLFRYGAIAALAALSHPILDDLAKATYHPPKALWGDPFWVVFHLLALTAAVAFAWRFRRHWVGMLFSVTPDFDWFLGRPFGLWSEGGLHAAFRSIPGLAAVDLWLGGTLPDLRHVRSAALFEGALVALTIALIWRLTRQGHVPAKELAQSSADPVPVLKET
jgi:hypothetical protein